MAKKLSAKAEPRQHVYFFGDGKADGNRNMKDTARRQRAPAWPK